MDLLDKAEEIAMISLLVLYNTNLVPFAICALPPLADYKQWQFECKKTTRKGYIRSCKKEEKKEENCSRGGY
jgi:hypothetical protein